MSLAVRVRDKSNTFCSDSSVGDNVADRGTMVVVICSFGIMGDRGDCGGGTMRLTLRLGGDWPGMGGRFNIAGAALRGALILPTPMGSRLTFVGVVVTSVGIDARGGSAACVCKNAGRRGGDPLRVGGGVGKSCPFVLNRALICSSDGRGFPLGD